MRLTRLNSQVLKYFAGVAACLLVLTAMGQSQAGSPTRLTNITSSYPAMSPDGHLIAFQSNRTGVDQIYTMKPDGTDVKQITSGDFFNGNPSWSPDGKQIAYESKPNGKWEVWVMNADGTGQRQLAAGGDDGHPHWSKTGRIVFNSNRTTPDMKAPWSQQWHEVFSVKPDGTDLRQHTHCKSVCTYASLSPDGTKLLYRKVTDMPSYNWDLSSTLRNSEVYVADADGSNERNLTNNAAYDGWPQWSPDGKRILFTSNRLGPANIGQIFIMNADGTGLKQVTSSSIWSYQQGSWSPDGKKIYAYQDVETETFEFGDVVVFDVPQ